MSTLFLIPTTRRELARRSSGGLDVALFWSQDDGTIDVEVRHPDTGVHFGIAVPGDRALDAFYHPFAYLDG
jgi:hypothetical protein